METIKSLMDLIEWSAESGRFVICRDTCREIETILNSINIGDDPSLQDEIHHLADGFHLPDGGGDYRWEWVECQELLQWLPTARETITAIAQSTPGQPILF